ncbi:MAG: ABC-2 family transporter protein [Deltaproteobacteria bacterium]|nr:ABC-2 family transporter protein [Deltaproteobacteria bacterium]
MRRYLKLLYIQVRASMTVSMQYRVDFLVQGVVSVFWAALALVPLGIVFSGSRQSVAGWSFPEVLLVLGWFTLLKALLEGAINPSLLAVIEHIRKGTLDFVLLKPADAQFLVSTSRFDPWRITDALVGLILFAVSFTLLGRWPRPANAGLALVMLAIAVLLLYSMWILVISAAFYVVRIDNLSFLLSSIFDAGRWPVNVFSGALRFVFTFVIPLAVMTTYPAMALLGKLELTTAAWAASGALAFAVAARWVWTRSLARYTSASS